MSYGKKRGMRSKRPSYRRVGRKTNKKRSGLTKKETSQVKAIAKKTVNKMAETKYFDVRTIRELSREGNVSGSGLQLVDGRAPGQPAGSTIKVLGFATGTGARLDGLSSYKYGWVSATAEKSIQAFQLGRIFNRDSTDEFEKAQSIVGQYVSPSFAQSEFNIQYIMRSTDPFVDDTLQIQNPQKASPVQLRIVRVCPRPKKGSYNDVDPRYDLFVDQFGREIGIESQLFNTYELMMYKLNSRKYIVKTDLMPRMSPSIAYNTVFDYAPGTDGMTQQVQQQNQSSSMLNYKFKHNIGKELYYANPETVFNPQDGFTPEFVFIHAIPIGIQESDNASGIRVGVKVVGTFKDL